MEERNACSPVAGNVQDREVEAVGDEEFVAGQAGVQGTSPLPHQIHCTANLYRNKHAVRQA